MSGAVAGPRRVVFVNRFFWPDCSATSQLLTDLAGWLAESGWSVTVITSRLRYDDRRARLAAGETVGGVRVLRVATPGFGRTHGAGRLADYLGFHLAAARTLARTLAPGDLVVAATDPPLLSVTLARIAARRGARLVNWVHDLFPEVALAVAGAPAGRAVPLSKVPLGRPTGLPAALLAGVLARVLAPLARWRDRSLQVAVANVVLSEAMAARLRACGVPAAQVTVIPNWADTDAIRPLPAATSRLRQAVWPAARLVVGYAGNLGRAHDAATLFDAMLALRGRPDIAFLFIGGGAGMDWLRRRVATAGLDGVRVLPYQPREALADSLAAADLHLVSLRPGLDGLVVPSKLYGVLAAGRPVLFVGDPAGEVGTLVRGQGVGQGVGRGGDQAGGRGGKQMVDHGVGLVVAAGDGAGLARAIEDLAADAPRRAAIGARARALAEARFARSDCLPRWERVLAGAAAVAA